MSVFSVIENIVKNFMIENFTKIIIILFQIFIFYFLLLAKRDIFMYGSVINGKKIEYSISPDSEFRKKIVEPIY